MTDIVNKQSKNELVKYNQLSACLIRAFEVGEAQQALEYDICNKQRSRAKLEVGKIIVAEKDLKRICNVDTDKAISLMENILERIKSKDVSEPYSPISDRKIERLRGTLINHDTEIVDALRKSRV